MPDSQHVLPNRRSGLGRLIPGGVTESHINALRALAPNPRAPVPRPSRPQPCTPQPRWSRRHSLNYYVMGHKLKWQAGLSQYEDDAIDDTIAQIGLSIGLSEPTSVRSPG